MLINAGKSWNRWPLNELELSACASLNYINASVDAAAFRDS